VSLTLKGKETHDKMECLAKHLDKQLIDDITDDEMIVFLKVMNKIIKNAGKEIVDV